MSPEKQRLAIAEACKIVSRDQWGPLYKTDSGWSRNCPDYPNDLNAMHEAEKELTDVQHDKFGRVLSDICVAAYKLGKHWSPSPIHATAAQRAEAFFKTLNLWTE